MLGEPVPLDRDRADADGDQPAAAFIEPVVILRGRKLSFKQLDNGTVVIGGGHLATPYRDRNETVLDWEKLAISAAHRVGAVPGDAPGDHRARLGRHRGRDGRRHPGGRAERHVGGRVPPVRLLRRTASSSGRAPAR